MRCSCCENFRRPNYYVNLLAKFLDKCVSKLLTLDFFVCSFTILLWTAPILFWYKTGFFGVLLLFAIAINILRLLYVAIVTPVAKENSSNLKTETPMFDLKDAFDKLVEQNEVVTKQFEKLIEENRGLKKDLKNIGSERVAYSRREEDVNFIRKYLEDENVSLRKEIEDCENKLKDELNKNEQLVGVVCELEEEKEKLKDNLEEQKMRNQRLEEKNKKILERHEMKNEEIVEILRVTKLDIASNIGCLSNELAQVRGLIEKASDKSGKMKVQGVEENNKLMDKMASLEEVYDDLVEQYQSLSNNLASGVLHVQDLVKLLNEQKAICEKLLENQDNLFELLKENMSKIEDDTSEEDEFEVLSDF